MLQNEHRFAIIDASGGGYTNFFAGEVFNNCYVGSIISVP